MARNVFGNPITDETLRVLPEYWNQTITEEDRAKVALSLKDTVDTNHIIRQCSKDCDQANCYERLTRVLLYNATGNTVKFHAQYDIQGHVRKERPPLPSIGNGQWGYFEHVGTLPADESSGGVVYRGKIKGSQERDWMFYWLHNSDTIMAYALTGPVDSLDRNTAYKQLLVSEEKSQAKFGGCAAGAVIARESPTVAVYVGVMYRS